MAEADERIEGERFVVDAAYFRSQAGEAVRTFVAPLRGLYEAATGLQPRYERDGRRPAGRLTKR